MARNRTFIHAGALAFAALMIGAALACPARSAPTTIVNNGPAANRVDIVFLGDGYTQADLSTGLYNQHIQGYVDYMFSSSGFLADPFPRYRNFFNVHRIDVVSNQSGADIPSQSIFRDTALDATYDTDGIDRYLTISDSKADMILDQELMGTGITSDIDLVTVNHEKYGGSGGTRAVFAGANFAARELAIHEMAHSYSGLDDEYVAIIGAYTGPEPSSRNITKNPNGQWDPWLGFVDARSSELNIGVYEGAVYSTGLYRPSLNSKMRVLGQPFNAVSREAFIHDIYQYVDPLDDWLDNGSAVVDAELWAEVVDPDVIGLQWYVDDVLVPGATGAEFLAREFGYGPGTYDVRVRAYDEVLNYSFTGGLLDLVRRGFDALEQSVSWSLTITPGLMGDYDGDGFVDLTDYELWQRTFGSDELLAADDNNNGIVDGADFVIWSKFYVPGEGAGGVSIPEPTTAAITLAALLACAGARSIRIGMHRSIVHGHLA